MITFLIVIVLVLTFSLTKKKENELSPVRVIIDNFGWVNFVEEPAIDDMLIKVGEETVVWRYEDFDMLKLKILEVKEETILVEFYLLTALYPETVYSSEAKKLRFWIDKIEVYIDEIPKNTCYAIKTMTADSGMVVYLTFDIEEGKKHLTCGHGKLLLAWYEDEEIRIGIVKDKRIKVSEDSIPKVIENNMTVDEILDYFLAHDCRDCFDILIIEDAKDREKRALRFPSIEEYIQIKELFPMLPYCH